MLGENDDPKPSGSDVGGLLADLLEGARRRNLSANSLAAYEIVALRIKGKGSIFQDVPVPRAA
ncbi:MAG TPA: hypothetical protein VIS96_14295 [Terrimicrobiaceae bacterium]